MSTVSFPEDRNLDFICLGRANIDLYTLERGTSLSETSGFVKNVGGSPANIATALSRLGHRVGIITKVSDDQLGHYVLDFLNKKNIDVSQVIIDSSGETRTSLAFAEVKPQDCDVLFYRKNAADLQIAPEEIDPTFINSAKAILISGTALSASPSRDAMFEAAKIAHQKGTLVCLDLDYRSSAWQRPEDATRYYTEAAKLSDVLIGNREEINLLAFPPAIILDRQRAEYLLDFRTQIVIMKDGAKGCKAYTANDEVYVDSFRVEVLKPYGAGDAFAGAFLHGLLLKQSLDECLKLGAAAGAIVVTKESCTGAMPTLEEITTFRKSN